MFLVSNYRERLFSVLESLQKEGKFKGMIRIHVILPGLRPGAKFKAQPFYPGTIRTRKHIWILDNKKLEFVESLVDVDLAHFLSFDLQQDDYFEFSNNYFYNGKSKPNPEWKLIDVEEYKTNY